VPWHHILPKYVHTQKKHFSNSEKHFFEEKKLSEQKASVEVNRGNCNFVHGKNPGYFLQTLTTTSVNV
jgi:hypothetical protein